MIKRSSLKSWSICPRAPFLLGHWFSSRNFNVHGNFLLTVWLTHGDWRQCLWGASWWLLHLRVEQLIEPPPLLHEHICVLHWWIGCCFASDTLAERNWIAMVGALAVEAASWRAWHRVCNWLDLGFVFFWGLFWGFYLLLCEFWAVTVSGHHFPFQHNQYQLNSYYPPDGHSLIYLCTCVCVIFMLLWHCVAAWLFFSCLYITGAGGSG